MTRLAAAWIGLLALALVAPLGEAQHVHGTGPVRLVTPLGDPAVTTVGSMNGFTALAVGADDVPDFHQDLPLRISLNGAVVFESTADSGHDYDGVQTVWIVFAQVGTFVVEALAEDGTAAATLQGTVLPMPAGGYGYTGHGTVTFPFGDVAFAVEDEGPFDAWADVRNGARLVSTATLHAGAGSLAWRTLPTGPNVAQPLPLVFAARPVPNETRPAQLFGSFGFLGAGLGVPDPATLVHLATLPTATNAVVDVTGDGLRLVGTYDPWTRVGTETLMNIAILGMHPDGGLVDDLRLTAALTGATTGSVWSSSDILERDGIWEFASLQSEPGLYVLQVEATSGAGSARIDVPYLVLPPSDPAGAGPIGITVEVPDNVRAGQAVPLTVIVRDATGAPFDHSEVLLDVYGPSVDLDALGFANAMQPSAFTLRGKLHTHADGHLRIDYAFPVAGNYTLWLSPSSLEARPVAIGGAPISFAATRVDVHVLPADDVPNDEVAQASPSAGLLLAVLALGALAVARRR